MSFEGGNVDKRGEQCLMKCVSEDPDLLIRTIKVLGLKDKLDVYCNVDVGKLGIKFSIEYYKSYQGNVYFDMQFFQEYQVFGDSREFCVKIDELLSAFETVKGVGGPFCLTLLQLADRDETLPIYRFAVSSEYNTASFDVNLPMYNTVEMVEHFFGQSSHPPVVAKVRMHTTTLYDVIYELDAKENREVLFTIRPNEFSLKTNELTLPCTTIYPGHSIEIEEIFVVGTVQHFKYTPQLIKFLKPIIQCSSNVSFEINEEGLLRARFDLATTINNPHVNSEFFITPLPTVTL